MGVGFYLSDPELWNKAFYRENYRLGVPLSVFSILRDLLRLQSPLSEGDCTGQITASALLEKIGAAQAELKLHGREWERSPEPAWEGQENQAFKVLGFPGISQEYLESCLVVLDRIACYAKEHDLSIRWS